ncbi:MAG: AAA-like domain-containing protein [Xenococcaceae cyanobacterium MO_167.B52]|nr:AAA-like domain-containing protein [Xenococcaceae cyanobacterium MO_167.B52]
MNDLHPVKKILILSANPKGTTQLRLDEEVREIEEGLLRAKKRDKFRIKSPRAVRYRDIRRAILDFEPHILHFSGHGAGEQGLVFEDETGQEKLVNAEALAGLFKLFSDKLECVVLNACYSEVQATAIAKSIPYVVGMKKAIGDKAAIEFAVGFYDALGAGKSYEFAYKLGCSAIAVAGIPEKLTPQLLTKEDLACFSSTPSFYIERPPIEQNCYQAIMEPGALLRIKAPTKMGKTLLLEKVLEYASQQNYQTVKFDFQLADRSVLTDFKTFLQWFCVSVADSLDLEDKLDEYWRDIFGLNKNCTRYLQKYLLSVTDIPLVLALDNFEQLFAEKKIFGEFCLLLRGWYETAKQGTRVGQLWKKLRLIVVYSTDDYPKLNTNHSPFNVGLLVELFNLNESQLKQLVKLYGLEEELDLAAINSLMRLVEGNPYLMDRALVCIKNQSLSLEQLLQTAPTDEGIYSNRLRQLLWNLQQNPQLEAAFKKVVTASKPIMLDTERGFKLKSMGLVKLSGDGYLTSCDLYQQYFSVHLKDTKAGG